MSSFVLSLIQFSNFLFFFFNDTATTEIYTLSLHDALPISRHGSRRLTHRFLPACRPGPSRAAQDRKSTRLNSSHLVISYAVFCLKKKKKKILLNDRLIALYLLPTRQAQCERRRACANHCRY